MVSQQQEGLFSKQRTGRATDSEVASSAAMSVMIHRLPNAARKRQPGSNFSDCLGSSSSEDRLGIVSRLGTSSFGSASLG